MPWLLNIGGKVQGPFDAARIRQMADAGELKPSDLMWRSGMKNWVAASEVKGLFRTAEGSAPLPPAGQAQAAAQDQSSAVAVERAAVDERVRWPRTKHAVRFAARSGLWLTVTYTSLRLLPGVTQWGDRWKERLLEEVRGSEQVDGVYAISSKHFFGLRVLDVIDVIDAAGRSIRVMVFILIPVQIVAYLVTHGWRNRPFSAKPLGAPAPFADSIVPLFGLAAWSIYLNRFWYGGIVYVAYGYAGYREDPASFLKGVLYLVVGVATLVWPGPRAIVWMARLAYSGGSAAAHALRDWIRGEWSRR